MREVNTWTLKRSSGMCDWMNEERRAVIDKRLQNTLHAKYEIGNSEIITEAMAQLDEIFLSKKNCI